MFDLPPALISSLPGSFAAPGTKDGEGAGDHDRPYRFGRRPTSLAPYPFSTRQYARLLVLRSRVRAGLAGLDARHAE
jgi:hypothetical protein